jgi:hypothetical protein
MPRLTPEELQAAKRKKAEEEAAERERKAAEQERQAAEAAAEREFLAQERERLRGEITERNAQLQITEGRYLDLVSASDAIYGEVSKQAAKWPTMPITERTLERTNKLINAVRELLKDEADDFMSDITELVPAGDLPQNRDVVVILSEVRAALARFQSRYVNSWKASHRSLEEELAERIAAIHRSRRPANAETEKSNTGNWGPEFARLFGETRGR